MTNRSHLQQPPYSKAGIAAHPVTQVIGGRVKVDVGSWSIQCCLGLHLLHQEAYMGWLGLPMDPRPVMRSMEDPRVGSVRPTILGPGCPLQVKHLMQEIVGPLITNLNTPE